MKKKYRKFLAATVSTAVVASVVTPMVPFNVMNASASESVFSDVKPGSFYYEAVTDLSARGILRGYSDGTFKPNQVVTRAETAVIIANALNLSASDSSALTYTDVQKGDWYYNAIAAVTEAGIMVGKNNDKFGPGEALTRAQMAKVISIAYNLKADSSLSNAFTDVKSDRWYAGYVESLLDNKVTSGLTKTTYGPNFLVTRGQMAAFIYRAENASVTIEKVSDTSLTVDGETYELSDAVKSILNSNNSNVLKDAKIKFKLVGNTITDIKYIEITTSGKEGSSVVLDGKGGSLNGDLVINADYVSVMNLTVKGDFTLSGNVQNGFYSNQLVVEGETIIENNHSEAAANKYSIAAEKTKVKIVFENSTLKVVHVNNDDASVEASGTTTLLEITVSSNAAITAANGVVIPKLTLKIGADEVELNGTVQEITVDSVDEITLLGTANIENVIIKGNTSVNLNTTGEIKQIESQSKDAKITIKEGTRIGNIVVPEGTEARDFIENYDDVKENIEQIGGVTNEDAAPPPPPPVTPSITVGTVTTVDAITVEITMAELDGVIFKWNGQDVLDSTYQNGKYTITVPRMTSGENNTLVVSKSGYNSSTKTVVWIDPFTYEQLGNWVTDRTEPARWSENNGWITITTSDVEPKSSWWAWEGRKSITDNVITNHWKVETEFEITEDLLQSGKDISSSIWLNVHNDSGETIDYSILQFRMDKTAGTKSWKTYDSMKNVWNEIDGIPISAGIYKIGIYFDNGTISQYINGNKVNEYKVGDGELSSVKEVILNAYNFRDSYSTSWKSPTVGYIVQPVTVTDSQGLKDALANPSIKEITLAADKVFQGQFKITRDVTIVGEEGSTITAPDNLVKDGRNSSIILVTNGANAKIENVTIDGAGKGTNGARFAGISFEDAGGEVKDVVVKDIKNGMSMNGMQEGIGIYAYNQDGESRTITVTGSTLTGYQKGGLVLSGEGLTVNVTGNTVIGAGETNIIAQNGIQVSYGAMGTVTGNTVKDHVCTTPDWVGSATGILFWDPGLGYQEESNQFDNNDMDVYENVAPVISGVTDNLVTNSSVIPNSTAEDIETITLTKDGNEIEGYSLGSEIIEEGSYVLTVTDYFENATTLNFTIDKTGATITDANLNYKDELWGSISATGTQYVDVEIKFSEDMDITNEWSVSFWTKDSNGEFVELEGSEGRTVRKDHTWGVWKDMTEDPSGGTGATTFEAGKVYATAVNADAGYASDEWWNTLWSTRDAGEGVWVKISITDNAGNTSEEYAPIATETN